jgi:hypothetical protein
MQEQEQEQEQEQKQKHEQESEPVPVRELRQENDGVRGWLEYVQEQEQEQKQEQGHEQALGDLAAAALCTKPVLATVAGYLESPLGPVPCGNEPFSTVRGRALVRSHWDAMSRLGFLCRGTVSEMDLNSAATITLTKDRAYLRWLISASCAESMHFTSSRRIWVQEQEQENEEEEEEDDEEENDEEEEEEDDEQEQEQEQEQKQEQEQEQELAEETPWIHEGKCWICSASGKVATCVHLSCEMHQERQ